MLLTERGSPGGAAPDAGGGAEATSRPPRALQPAGQRPDGRMPEATAVPNMVAQSMGRILRDSSQLKYTVSVGEARQVERCGGLEAAGPHRPHSLAPQY